MKYFLLLIFIIISSCSFDTKTGIWNSGQNKVEKKDNRFKDFEYLYSDEKTFKTVINPSKDLKISLETIKEINTWPDEFFRSSNNLSNFSYTNNDTIVHKSRRLSKHQTKKLLYDNNLIFLTDVKGNIFVYSNIDQNIIFNYNFYKKKFKKIKKDLNIFVEKSIIFVSDNLGYVYAVDISKNKLIWAKKFKLPFRSNIKVEDDKIFLSDLNNTLYIINKLNGEKLRSLPTEEVLLKNDFINSLAIQNEDLYYLNTYGSLYSIDKVNLTINWFKNLNRSLDLNFNNLFYSNSIVLQEDKIIVSTDPYLYILNENSGSTVVKKSITSVFDPIISRNNIFLITKDNLLVCINLNSGEVIYSINIDQKISEYLDTKKKSVSIKSYSIVNNDIFIFLRNSYLIKFTIQGEIKNIKKLKYKMSTNPIFVDNSIMYLNKKNQLIILN